MTDLAKLVVRLEAETAKYQAGMERAQKSLARFEKGSGSSLKNISRTIDQVLGSAAVVALSRFVGASLDAADNLAKAAQSTGIAVEQLSALQFAASQAGVDADALSTSLAKLGKNAAAAAGGSKGAAEAFETIGVATTNANGELRTSEQLLLDLADQFSQYEDGASKAALAQEIFGKSGAALIPFLNQGRDGIEALKKEAAELGLVISTDTALAAEQFNDNLDKLKLSASALVTRALTPLLPVLNAFAGSAVDSAKSTDALDRGTRTLVTGFRLLLSAGVTVKSFFVALGTTLGGVAAAVVAASQGEFRGALEALRAASADVAANAEADNAKIAAIWDDTATKVAASVEVVQSAGKKALTFDGGAKAKAAIDALTEVRVESARKELTAREQLTADLLELTQTQEQAQAASYARLEAALVELYDQGAISAEEYNKRATAALDGVLEEVTTTSKKNFKKLEEETNKLTEFQKAAAQNATTAIADTLKSGFEGGLQGLAQRFGDLLLDLAAQAVAADIGAKIFGKSGGGTGEGLLGGALQALGGLFGGARAMGGPVAAGVPYLVGERGPELFVPSTSGDIEPNGGGGINVSNYFTIQAPTGKVSRQTEMQISAAAARGVANANRRNN